MYDLTTVPVRTPHGASTDAWRAAVRAATSLPEGSATRAYALGVVDGRLAVANSPVAPGSGSYALFGEPWDAPDAEACRAAARTATDRYGRAYVLGRARGIRAVAWRA